MDDQSLRKIREIQARAARHGKNLFKEDPTARDEREILKEAIHHPNMPKEKAAMLERQMEMQKKLGKKVVDEKVTKEIEKETAYHMRRAFESGELKKAPMDSQRKKFLDKTYGN